jgi:tRNA dimethylallyltransferase
VKKLLVVCGPTAVGKTSVGLKLAKKFNGEVVSADSRQVYQGMDVGTGKEIFGLPFTKRKFLGNFRIGFYQKEGVKIWLYDLVEPTYRFNVADCVRCADLVTENIWHRGKLPILVGGTGFYIKWVAGGIETLGVKPVWGLRGKLSNYGICKLQRILKGICPERMRRMNESDRGNPRRLIRAIEIATSESKGNHVLTYRYVRTPLNTLIIGLKAPSEVLYKKIDKRVDGRVAWGAEKEVRKLLGKGYNFENSVLGTTIGYKEWQPYFEGKSTREEVVQRWKFNEHGYARRQMTWFKKDKRINWFDIMEKDYLKRIQSLVKKWYYKS